MEKKFNIGKVARIDRDNNFLSGSNTLAREIEKRLHSQKWSKQISASVIKRAHEENTQSKKTTDRISIEKKFWEKKSRLLKKNYLLPLAASFLLALSFSFVEFNGNILERNIQRTNEVSKISYDALIYKQLEGIHRSVFGALGEQRNELSSGNTVASISNSEKQDDRKVDKSERTKRSNYAHLDRMLLVDVGMGSLIDSAIWERK